MTNLAGKVALVLGASAEGGTGWAIAETLADAGARVVVAARTEAGIIRLADKIGGKAFRCDAGDGDQIRQLVAFVLLAYGKIDIAVNSAGRPVMSMIADVTDDQIMAGLMVNYVGNVHFIKNVAGAMSNGGSIVLILSMSTTHPVEPNFSYACGKAASDCLVRYAAMEFGPRGIKVNSINPGLIQSEMASGAIAIPGLLDAFVKETPLRRIATPQDIAEAALWLCGASFVTGLNIPVNGGNQLTRFPFSSELGRGRDAYKDSIPIGDR